MSELPDNWVECLLGDVAIVNGGGTPDTSDTKNFSEESGIAWLTPADLSNYEEIYVTRGKRFLTKNGYQASSAKLLPKGAVLFSSRAPIGYVAIASNEIATNQGFKSFVCADGIIPEFVYHYLKSAKPLAEELASGTTFAEISGKNAAKIPFVLPPTAEQLRIAAKLTALQLKALGCKKRLERIPILLKRFRQSVIAAACSGKLTEDWRANDGISELPEGWCWKRLADLLPPKGGLFDGPFGSNLKTDDYTNVGVRVVRLENVGPLRFFDDKRTYISKNKYESLRKHTVREGDIIFSSFISDEMRVCMLPRLGELAIAKADCFCIRPLSEVISPNYLLLQLACDTTLTALMASVHGATRPRVNISQLKELTIRMCPRDEQETIVSRATQLFELADQIEARFQKAKAQIDKLTPAILAKAFRGELVPQDPNDEPAEKLLERIRAARAEQAESPAKRRSVKSDSPGRITASTIVRKKSAKKRKH